MTDHLIIVDDKTADFLRMVLEIWRENTASDRSQQPNMVYKFHIERQLEAKYTLKERQDIWEAALQIAPTEGEE